MENKKIIIIIIVAIIAAIIVSMFAITIATVIIERNRPNIKEAKEAVKEYLANNDELKEKFGENYIYFISEISIYYFAVDGSPASAKVGDPTSAKVIIFINVFHPCDVSLEYKNGKWTVVETEIYF